MATEQRPAGQPYGEIFDRGYQHYDGPRLGRSYAIRRLIVFSIRRGLGIKGKWTAKVVPILLYIAAYLPAIIIIGILAFVPSDELTGLGYDSLYGTLELIVLAFAASLAPEMLCDDRRERTLQLYFSRPLTRLDYLFAKVSAMGILMSTVVFGPPLLLFIGLTLTDDSPGSYFVNNLTGLVQIATYGVLVSVIWAALALSVSLFTVRKGIAAAVVLIGVMLSTGVANAFFEAFDTASWRGWFVFLSPLDYVDALRLWIFNDEQQAMMQASDIPEILLGVWLVLIVVGALFLMRRAYLQEQ